jgi:hypothetical protein
VRSVFAFGDRITNLIAEPYLIHAIADGENQLILNHPETNGFLSIIFADDFSESYLITEGYHVPKPPKEGEKRVITKGSSSVTLVSI